MEARSRLSNGGTRFWFENGDSEDLLVTSLGGDLYRLEQSSFIGDAMYGDVVRARRREDGVLLFLGIEAHSDLVSQSWVLSRAILDSPECSSVLDDVLASGGNWERAFGGVLLIHVPEARAQEFADRVKQLPGSPA
jgi:hypothetical protein